MSAEAVVPSFSVPHMRIYRWKDRTLLLLLAFYAAGTDAIDFSQCLVDVIDCAQFGNCTSNIPDPQSALSVLRTSKGLPVTSADLNITTANITALSYSGCVQYCGNGMQQFNWTSFAQDFAAWLLPYLALVSQLPFGALRRMDNLMSAIYTVGSPTLAGYSLYMTLLNARWVNDQLFAEINYPSPTVRRSVARVLSNLQQVPLRVHPGESGCFESLVVHPDNDSWWTTLAEELDFSHRWSIASATSTAWVVIAYLLTVADSIYNVPDNIESNGQGTGSGWLWLLPIVVGWLVLSPKCDYKRVHDAYQKANKQVFVADPIDRSAAPAHVTSNFGLTISPRPGWKPGGDITSPDESRIPPVFNYARIFPWYRNVYVTYLFYGAACRKWSDRVGVDNECVTGNLRTDVPRASRLGTRDQIIRYCQPHDHEYTAANILWPRGLFTNMIIASLMSLSLQWGTTGAAFLVVWFTPTVGLGCRSLAYLIYAAVSTVVWMLLVSSSALGHYAHHLLHDDPALDLERDSRRTPPGGASIPFSRNSTISPIDGGPGGQSNMAVPSFEIPDPNDHVARENIQSDTTSDASTNFTSIKRRLHTRRIYGQMISHVADWLRWIGKSLAIANAIGIIANSIFQYAGVYANCYCDSTVYSWGASAFNVINPDADDFDLARRAWIGGLALASSCCLFFVGSIYLIRDSLPQ